MSGRGVPAPESTSRAEPPRVLRTDVRSARRRLAGRVRKTPVFHTSVDGPDGPVPVSLKLEFLQHGGTFKVRGALNALLAAGEQADHVVVASGGNAGIAVALAAAQLGKACTVVVPESAPHTKVAAMWAHGAEVLWHGTSYAEAQRRAVTLADERGAVQLHAYDMPAVVAGAGVIGLELEEQVRGRPPVLAAVGGGGLIAGLGAALGKRRQIVGIESEHTPALSAALAAGRPVEVGVQPRPTELLCATRVGDIAFDIARRHRMPALAVADDAIGRAREYLWREFRVVVELEGAAALAAVQSGVYRPDPGVRPIVVLCGANTELPVL
ncbi:serine/threonine dehydratase [Nocardia asteroides]|uniref:Threonine dehydratase n=1 Tax=Nocardia asteroides NBRC 15531 TaxID=1110697 RepID=U5EL37_NOCAS|nr:serine/threonine dehydratase [Nocardia asteroides]UGT47171.1 serine/threonine dehydratase [Nocardia asteroides]GAD87106.1 putative threonine dehydratase [Nocardia asteroides NBRC 15531]SFM77484.1 threonine dehydratase [Nocardia asteroides]VEG33948.1 Phenylserine dehydratase [Nocardia asteroides]